jgi:hypothetical protein
MVKVRCQRCGGKAEGSTLEEASMRIDHAIGLGIGKPCLGYPKAIVEPISDTERPKEKPPVEIKTKELKSEDKTKNKKKSKKDS